MIRLLVLVYLISLIGCDNIYTENNSVYNFTLNSRLEIDDNGYYHLDVIRENRQTLHRINGSITKNNISVENVFFEWSSNLYWRLNDEIGYIIIQNLNDKGMYVSTDTSYITGFEGFEVQTINCCSYSNSKGEVNTMIGVVQQMIGDTMIVNVSYLDNTESFGIVLD
jgi:hypothetical protein|tara:strand:+ start:165 stop:665 length:501 start_codon:yes stop_codon:yes gene_type:complete